jgi:hypothetical protein
MTYHEADIMHEDGSYWILRVPTGLEVYRAGATHSTRCAQIGFASEPARAMEYALREIERRKAKDAAL